MRALPPILVTLALAGAACSENAPTASPDPTTVENGSRSGSVSGVSSSSGGGAGRFLRALTPFDDCRAFLDHVKAAARDRVGPYGLEQGYGHWGGDDVVLEGDIAMDEATDAGGAPNRGDSAQTLPATADGDDSGAGGDFTGTNTQEVGVDEPDIVKTDGDRIITIVDNVLTYVDVSGDEAVATDRLTLPEGWGHELFFSGDRAFVFTNDSNWFGPMPVEPLDPIGGDAEAEFASDETMIEPDTWHPAALVLEIDLSDPSELSVAASMRIAGQYLSARAIDDHVRLAVSSGPQQLPWVVPQSPSGEERATRTNREIIDESTLEQWLPSYKVTGADFSDEGPLLECGRVHHPVDFAGFDVISVVDLSLADGLVGSVSERQATGVLAGGQTVYSSMDRFYVATTKWVGADLAAADEIDIVEWNEDYETDVHAFAIAPGEPTEYVASGSIDGSLLNQFSMDEHDGFLRVIATDGSPWGGGPESETRLAVLEEQGEQLVEVGEVGGLGRGERLFSARLMGDVGFAVTFRQIDPFYVLDLRDPRNPQVAGELKIPGFSTYLHPVGDDLVLGVGQDATEEGRTLGLKLSLFDVSEPNDPREVSVWTLRDANSPVEWDHRAFQMSGSTAIVPAQSWSGEFNGAVVFDIGETINELGRVSHRRDDVAPTSDCRTLTADDVPGDSELWWMADDPFTHIQLCESGSTGGYGDHFCDRLPVDEIRYWFPEEGQAEALFEGLGAGDDDFVEICYPGEYHQQQIERSLVVDGTLWTMTRSALQANDFATFDYITQLPIR